jgi:hypothetical protein
VTDLRQLRDGVTGSLPTALNLLATKILLALPAAPAASDPRVLALTQVYGQSQKFDYDSSMAIEPHEGYVDLVDFASRLRDSSDIAVPADVRAAAGDLVAATTSGLTPAIDTSRAVSGSYNGTAWSLGGANGLSIFLPLGEQDYRPTKADPSDYTKPFQAERQLKYYADPSQLLLTHDAPQWAALLVRLESTVPIIRTGGAVLASAGLAKATSFAAALAAAPTIDTRAFHTPGQVIPGYRISGVIHFGNAGLAGVSVSDGAGHMALTGSDGSYIFSGLSAGGYTLTPSLGGYTFNPVSISLNLQADASGKDFTAIALDTWQHVYLPLLQR